MPDTIEGERIVLRRHTLDFAESIFAAIESDRQRLQKFLPWVDTTLKIEDERNYIHATQNAWSDFTLFDFSVFRKSDSRFLGTCGVHHISWENLRCELGYWISSEFEGQGYISEAVQNLEKAIFAIGFNRIEIHCSTANARSAKVAIRNQYQLKGTLRENGIEKGVFRSTHIFGKLKSDN